MTMTVMRQITLVEETCLSCEMLFAVTDTFRRERIRDGQWFYCPAGHAQRFAEPENARLKKELERAKRRTDQLLDRANRERRQREAAERSASAYKGQTTRLKNRAVAGVCPHCNRTFQQLARHMHSKHPEMVEEARSG